MIWKTTDATDPSMGLYSQSGRVVARTQLLLLDKGGVVAVDGGVIAGVQGM